MKKFKFGDIARHKQSGVIAVIFHVNKCGDVYADTSTGLHKTHLYSVQSAEEELEHTGMSNTLWAQDQRDRYGFTDDTV